MLRKALFSLSVAMLLTGYAQAQCDGCGGATVMSADGAAVAVDASTAGCGTMTRTIMVPVRYDGNANAHGDEVSSGAADAYGERGPDGSGNTSRFNRPIRSWCRSSGRAR